MLHWDSWAAVGWSHLRSRWIGPLVPVFALVLGFLIWKFFVRGSITVTVNQLGRNVWLVLVCDWSLTLVLHLLVLLRNGLILLLLHLLLLVRLLLIGLLVMRLYSSLT